MVGDKLGWTDTYKGIFEGFFLELTEKLYFYS